MILILQLLLAYCGAAYIAIPATREMDPDASRQTRGELFIRNLNPLALLFTFPLGAYITIAKFRDSKKN